MKWYCHTLTILTALITVNSFQPLSLLSALSALIGSLAPDLIERSLALRHRNKFIHNFLTGAITLFVFGIIDSDMAWFGVGYLHHLILDITKSGVYAGKRRIRSLLDTSNVFHNVAVILIHFFVTLIVFNP